MRPTLPSMKSPRFPATKKAFSLIELIAVIAIVGIVATVTVPQAGSILSARSLSTGVNLLSNSAMLARQTAISTGSKVALITTAPSTAPSSPDAVQAVILLKSDRTGLAAWTPITEWKRLPLQVVIEVTQESGRDTFYSSSTDQLSAELELPEFDKAEVTDYSYIVFLPDGSIDSKATDNPGLSVEKRTPSKNSFELVFQSQTGRCKLSEQFSQQQQ